MVKPEPELHLRPKRLLAATAGAAALATVIVLAVVLPAEFNRDPLGVGRLTGISRLWAPAEKQASAGSATASAVFYAAPPRSDVVEIPLGYVGGGAGPYSLEYKVRMKKGRALVYSWEIIGAPNAPAVLYDFHGHTLTAEGREMTVSEHRKGTSVSGSGSLVAPFDGIQGWYFENPTDAPAVVRVRLHGFYELAPPGTEGNELGIEANQPADAVRRAMLRPSTPAR